MPYLLISTQIRLVSVAVRRVRVWECMSRCLLLLCPQETGPTLCGDEWSDTDIMKYLGAELQPDSANCL